MPTAEGVRIKISAPPSDRLEFVDALRGFALFGVFWANLLIFSGIEYMSAAQRTAAFPSRPDAFAYGFERFFIENKFMGLFSTLFGISFWLFLSRARARGGSATRLFYRRIFWLFAIGLAHGWLLWAFDILRFYALWAVLLPLFVAAPPRRLLRAALAASVLVPALVAALGAAMPPPGAGPDMDAIALAAFSHGSYRDVLAANWRYDWYLTLSIDQIDYQVAIFGRLLLGLWIARTLDLGDLARHRVLLRRVLLVGGLSGVAGSTVFAGSLFAGRSGPLLAFARHLVVEGGQLGLTLAYAAALGLAYLGARGSAIRFLAPLGRMALTWYLFQTVFGIWLFYGFPRGPGLMGRVGPASLTALCLVGYPAQVLLARAWLARFRFGPAEWLWRCLTYGKMQPFRAARGALEPGAP